MDGLNRPYQNAQETTGTVTYAPVVLKTEQCEAAQFKRYQWGCQNVDPGNARALCGCAYTGVGAWMY
jgi:hypothetical protein